MEGLTVHVDLLRQLNKLHLGRHVAHGAHAVAQVPAVDIAVLVFVKLSEGLPELWGSEGSGGGLVVDGGVGGGGMTCRVSGAEAARGPADSCIPPTPGSTDDAWLCTRPRLQEAEISLPLFPPTFLSSSFWMAEQPSPLRGQFLPSISSGRSDLS